MLSSVVRPGDGYCAKIRNCIIGNSVCANGVVSGLNRTRASRGMFYLFEIQMNLHVEFDRVTIGFDVIQFGFGKCSDSKFLIMFRLDFPNSKDL